MMPVCFVTSPDIDILVVGVTRMVNQYELNEIASDPDDSNVFLAADFTSLGDVRTGLKRAMCNGNVIHLRLQTIVFDSRSKG